MDFWPEYQDAAGAFLMGEVWNHDVAYLAPYQHNMDSLINFPLQDQLWRVFIHKEDMAVIADGLQEQVVDIFYLIL